MIHVFSLCQRSWMENIYDAVDPGLAAKMHKAIAVIQFKVEEAIIQRHPEYEMENRMLLTAVDYQKGTDYDRWKRISYAGYEFSNH